jgi:hypothetical protein
VPDASLAVPLAAEGALPVAAGSVADAEIVRDGSEGPDAASCRGAAVPVLAAALLVVTPGGAGPSVFDAGAPAGGWLSGGVVTAWARPPNTSSATLTAPPASARRSA